MKPFNILVTAAGRRGALVKILQRSLADMGLSGRVLGADMSAWAPAMYLVDKGFIVPRVDDPAYLDRVEEICRQQDVCLVVPTIDPELPILAEARERFLQLGTTLHVSDPATIAIAYSKDRTHDWLVESGIPTVDQWSQETALERAEKLDYPVVVKPTRGSASIGVSLAQNPDELRWALRDGRDYVVQSRAQGQEYTVSAYVDRSGQVRCLVPRLRIEVRAGEVSKGRTVRNEAVRAVVRTACEKLPGAWGAVNVQVFHDPDTDNCRVIEMNPRFGGGFPLAWAAGARFPVWLIQEVLGMDCEARDEWEDDLTMLRYDEAVFVRRADARRIEEG